MQTPSHEYSLDQAPLVCLSCKARKRKCDKARPMCSPCSKRNLTCSYSRPLKRRPSPTEPPASTAWSSFPIDERAQAQRIQTLDYPTIVFLSPSLLSYGQLSLPTPTYTIPQHIISLLGPLPAIHSFARNYFTHIHTWLPLISKHRFYTHYLPSLPSSSSPSSPPSSSPSPFHSYSSSSSSSPSFPTQPEIALLLLSQKLITTLPPSRPGSPQTALYHATKHYHLALSSSTSADLSLPILQANVLIALYELGHGIYPAAYLSVGAAARYAYALGLGLGPCNLGVDGKVESRRVLTLVEFEEQRRVWWGIVILDRFVAIGCPGRPFATPDPSVEEFLPADDEAWDQGIVNLNDLSTLSAPKTGHMSKFALLCQAARLLGQVLRYVSSSSSTFTHDNDNDHEEEEGIQLDRTLQSMVAASLDLEEPDDDQISFVYSTLLALHSPWLYSESTNALDQDRAQRARGVVQQITERIRENLMARRCFLGRDPEGMAPWGLFFAYHVCGFHMRAAREGEGDGEEVEVEVVRSLKETFAAVDVRWNAAGVYLQLLEAQEVLICS